MVSEKVKRQLKEASRRYRQRHPDKVREGLRDYYERHKEYFKNHAKLWRENNRGKRAATQMKRHCAKISCTPTWLTKEQTKEQIKEMESLYIKASKLGLHVDHIVPLQGKTVSGLHVPCNLQLLTPEENWRKHAKWE